MSLRIDPLPKVNRDKGDIKFTVDEKQLGRHGLFLGSFSNFIGIVIWEKGKEWEAEFP